MTDACQVRLYMTFSFKAAAGLMFSAVDVR